jgi:hypothetical protein
MTGDQNAKILEKVFSGSATTGAALTPVDIDLGDVVPVTAGHSYRMSFHQSSPTVAYLGEQTGGSNPFGRLYVNGQPTGADLAFVLGVSAPSRVMTVTDGGLVGVGTATPGADLTIIGQPDSNQAHIAFGVPTAVPGSQSAALTFLGNGVQHAGFSYVPNTDGTGALTLAFGGNSNAAYDPPAVTFRADGSIQAGGRVLMGFSPEYNATSDSENLRLVRGLVNPDGTTNFGVGWTCTHLSAGHYRLTFTPTFSTFPTVTVTPNSAENTTVFVANFAGPPASGIDVDTKVNGVFVDTSWNFIAAGGR